MAVFDQMRRDLAAAKLLTDEFVANPERLSDVSKMGKGRPAQELIAANRSAYAKIWSDSVTLKPLTKDIGSVEAVSGDMVIQLRLAAPEVLVLVMTP